MSELRELLGGARAFIAYAVDQGVTEPTQLIIEIDKAIAEAPDSPLADDPRTYGPDFGQGARPDTLSEKPGLDAVRRAEDAVIGAARDLNVTMPDMGDGDPLRALDDALTALNDAERAALGSTDSEGR